MAHSSGTVFSCPVSVINYFGRCQLRICASVPQPFVVNCVEISTNADPAALKATHRKCCKFQSRK
eukprot:6459489-Amphidinium_carterae.1